MTGQELKNKLKDNNINLSQLGRDLGVSESSVHSWFQAADVKSGLLENIARAIGKPIAWIYGDSYTTTSIAADNNSIAAGRDVHTNSEAFIEALRIQQELTRTALDQNSRLIAVIENLAKK